MNKQSVLKMIVSRISEDLEAFTASAKAAHKEATHEQNKAENKYDTRGLEASYLARGQSLQAAELRRAEKEFESLVISPTDPHAPVEVGTLLRLENQKGKAHYFVGPKAGGLEVVVTGVPVVVITPHSPLGQQVMGKKQGDTVTLPGGKNGVMFRIAEVW